MGGAVFAYRGLSASPKVPDVFFDTTGCAFTFPVAKFMFGCRVFSYTHYPTISTDMLNVVYERRPTYNNDAAIALSATKNYAKLLYYVLFSIIYGIVGSMVDFVMVNSSWTCGHIRNIWRFAPPPEILYPPCDASGFSALPISSREPIVLSIGQFRPEKDHSLQIRAFADFASREDAPADVRLVLLGGVRDESDEARVTELRALCEELGVTDQVEFVLNKPYSVLKSYLSRASVGLHTMWNEHFGIGVVEMMAAGLITVAHDSGGPKADIIRPLDGDPDRVTGYLASTSTQYADRLHEIFSSDEETLGKIRRDARIASMKFDDAVFIERLDELLKIQLPCQ